MPRLQMLDLFAEDSCGKLSVWTFKSFDLGGWLAVSSVKSVSELLIKLVVKAVRDWLKLRCSCYLAEEGLTEA